MRFGISNLSIIPLRSEASDRSEMTSQLIFGEHYKIIENQKKWSKIQVAHDNYVGWISNNQVHEIDIDEFERLEKEIPTLTTDILDIIEGNFHQPIVIGSVLPFFKSDHALINNKMYKFTGNKTQGFSQKKHLITNALIFLNAPYLWGGRTPFGIDCSGFTQIIYRLQGIKIPRDAYQQINLGNKINENNHKEEGDLAFFENKNGRIVHVGIVMSDNQIIHASGKVRIDKLDTKGIFNSELQTYTHKLHSINKII
mgnify:CR=1 FL=1|tara:strand:+ start:625 stop:1389 length:765 start_codon:yes stop_codon:yes gene_type:complete